VRVAATNKQSRLNTFCAPTKEFRRYIYLMAIARPSWSR
jgi:hypothetical protein